MLKIIWGAIPYMGMTPFSFFIYLLTATVLSMLIALFDGLSLGLLMSLMKGMIQRDFSFIHD
ncbi:MAG: hypothetical protein JW893_08075, partial [Candidatus Omnitrophica bacterium]|nr:hypothetical protein [Candidatus Omnitrophota bacterium]